VTINQENRTAGLPRGQGLVAVGGLLGALAASSCCLLPLVLFGLGVSGAWIGNLTQLAPYQPFFIAATIRLPRLRILARLPLIKSCVCPWWSVCAAVVKSARPARPHCGNGAGQRSDRLRLPRSFAPRLM